MKGTHWVVAVGLALIAGPAQAGAVTGDARLVTLKNGMRVILAPDDRATAVDVAVWYESGARFERTGKTGQAHLFEHLMFRGSERYDSGEHRRRVRAEGGSSGAYATHDFTCFYQTLPSDALELAFQLEADRMTGLELTQEALDSERRLVADERARQATPIRRGLERLYAMAWNTHPYRGSLFGLERDLERLTLQDCKSFYRARFGPDRAVVTVVGHFESEQALELARRYFEPLKPAGGRDQALPADKPVDAERRAVEPGVTPVRIVMAGWRGPRRADRDWPELSLLATLLTRASDARLTRALVVDPPLCLAVQGDMDSRRDASMFYLAASVAPQADSAEVESRLFGELGRLLVEPVGEEELERAKRQIETAVWFGLQTSRGRAQALGTGQMLAGDFQDLERQLERIRACTPADLQRAARHLDPARRNVLWLKPSQDAMPTSDPGGRP